MPPKNNPLRLNPLQCKTLALLQALAGAEGAAQKDESSGNISINRFPAPHGDHFHIGEAVVMTSDATGLSNESVWKALERKGLIQSNYPLTVHMTPEGMAYDSGMADRILHRSSH